MKLSSAEHRAQDRGLASTALRLVLLTLWTALRLPLVTLLVILEPFVTIALMGIATLGVLMCLFNEFLLRTPHFPIWVMLGISLGSALMLLPYYGLIRLLSVGRR